MKRLRYLLAVLVFWGIPYCAFAQSYFVDAAIGNDSYAGTSSTVQSGAIPNGPWRTLTKVNAAPLQPGDAVYFRCGQSWRGTLVVVSSPDSTKPIKYSRFGSDCTDLNKPVITAAETLNGWQPYSGNIYVAKTVFNVAQLFADGVALRLAQYPNTAEQISPPHTGMLDTDQEPPPASTLNMIADSDLAAIADRDLIGAGVHVRAADFIINDRTITAFDTATSTITLNANADRFINADWGYYLDNKLWMLDEPGEWFFDGSDPANLKVYVWMPDGAPPGTRVVGGRDHYGIDATGATNVVIELMRVEYTGVGVQLPSSTSVAVKQVDVAGSYHRGISADKAQSGSIESCTVRSSVREGILVGEATNFKVLSNTVVDSGVIGSPKQSRGGIASSGSGVTISSNQVANSGYHGISFGKNSNVSNNRIENSCLVLNDCGGIYTGNSPRSNDLSPHNSNVIANTIMGVYGNRNGRDPDPTDSLAIGIYLDYRTSGVYVQGNTITRADGGIFIHSASENVIRENKLYNYPSYAIRVKERSSARITSPNKILGNQFFALTTGPAIILQPYQSDISKIATYDLNRYSALYTDSPATLNIVKITLFQDSKYTDTFLSLQQWRDAGYDVSGTMFDAFSISPYMFQPVSGNNILPNGSLDSDTSGWRAYSTQNDSVLTWHNDCPVPGCIALTTGTQSPSGSLVSGAFPAEAGKQYAFSFSYRADGDPLTFNVAPRMAGPQSFDLFQGRFNFTSVNDWQDASGLFGVPTDFVFNAGDYGGRVDFIVPPGRTLILDNIRVEEVTSVQNLPDDDSVLLLNPTGYDASFDCPDAGTAPVKCSQYVYFTDSSAVTWPITIGPRKSSIIVWAGNPFRHP
jgi:parallel beta-helix repeat protein